MKPAPLLGEHAVRDRGVCVYLPINPVINLRVAHWLGGNRGTVHIFNGRTEYIEKYYDVIEQFLVRGFNVTAHDWRGQGFSTRNDFHPNRCHIESFAFHQNDARMVMAHFSTLNGPHYLFCHSMGGAIGARYLIENKGIKAAVFSAPMFGIKLPAHLQILRPLMMKIVTKMGWMWHVAPGTKEANYETYTSFQKNQLTSDEAEWGKLQIQARDWPDIQCGGPTFYWAKAAYDEMEELENKLEIAAPALVFLGSNEDIVDPQAIHNRMQKQPNWRLVELDGARHEAYLEIMPIRQKLWLNIDMFIDQFS